MRRNSIQIAAVVVLALAAGCGRGAPQGPAVDSKAAQELRAEFNLAAGDGGGDVAPPSDAKPTGWQKLSGVVRMSGAAPQPALVNITASKAVCMPEGKPVFSDELLVDAQGGIANVAIYLITPIEDAEPWTHADAKSGKTDEVIFDQKVCRFITRVAALQMSQPMKVLNSDPEGHNTAIPDAGGFDQTIPSGTSAVVNFKKEAKQPFKVKCAIHPWMTAYVLPRKNSYFAITRADGSFDIPNLPTGVPLQFQLWHERTSTKGFKGAATNDSGMPQVADGGKITLTLDPSAEKKLEVTIDASKFK